jgi:hypothetical protein
MDIRPHDLYDAGLGGSDHSPAATTKSTGTERTRRERQGTIEGYLSLIVLGAYFLFPLLVRHPPLWVDVTVALVLSGSGLLLGLRGIRFGRGGGRIAGYISFIALAWFTFTFVVVGLNNGGAFSGR